MEGEFERERERRKKANTLERKGRCGQDKSLPTGKRRRRRGMVRRRVGEGGGIN